MRQPAAEVVPETTGPRLLLTLVPLNPSCQNRIFLYTSCCVSKPGLQQQITTNLEKQREVYSLTVLEARKFQIKVLVDSVFGESSLLSS